MDENLSEQERTKNKKKAIDASVVVGKENDNYNETDTRQNLRCQLVEYKNAKDAPKQFLDSMDESIMTNSSKEAFDWA